MDQLKSRILKNISNMPGWRTSRHVIVFESDDWGGIRMPSNEVYERLAEEGIDFTSDQGFVFNKYDSLETEKDLVSLFEVLSSVKDCNGQHAVFTPVSVVANPDFEKILKSGFSEYFFEPFTDTYNKYPGCEGSFRILKEGIDKKIFTPQFHGREHLNVNAWMKALQTGHTKTLAAFKNSMWGISVAGDPDIKVEFQAAFDFTDPGDLEDQKKIIASGLDLFKNLFGYSAVLFVPPNAAFSSDLESCCMDEGIRFLSLPKIHREPANSGKTYHWTGKKTENGITYITRNCLFEPCVDKRDWADSCLYDISTAFRWHKPAIISTHRVNYIGSLDECNRANGLNQLRELLHRIMKNWPDTEFVTSSELGELIRNG